VLIGGLELGRLLREALCLEGRRERTRVRTRRGYEVDWGSRQHVKDLADSLEELIRIRNAQPRTSKSRYVYARAVEEMRRQYRAARRYGIRHGLIQEE